MWDYARLQWGSDAIRHRFVCPEPINLIVRRDDMSVKALKMYISVTNDGEEGIEHFKTGAGVNVGNIKA